MLHSLDTKRFFKDDKIGVFHETGHNLGCGHLSGYCAPEFPEFSAATGIRYQSLMGGGAACDKKGLNAVRLKLFADSTKEYCEDGHCFSLGDETFDCASKIKDRLSKVVQNLNLPCDDINAPLVDYCVHQNGMKCEPDVKLDEEEFETKAECAEYISSNPDVCPSGIFYWLPKKGIKCRCCESDFDMVADSDDTLYEVSSDIDGDDFTAFSIAVMPLNNLGINLLAIFGLLAILRLGLNICCEQNKHYTIESTIEHDEI